MATTKHCVDTGNILTKKSLMHFYNCNEVVPMRCRQPLRTVGSISKYGLSSHLTIGTTTITQYLVPCHRICGYTLKLGFFTYSQTYSLHFLQWVVVCLMTYVHEQPRVQGNEYRCTRRVRVKGKGALFTADAIRNRLQPI